MAHTTVDSWLGSLNPQLRGEVEQIIGISSRYMDEHGDFYKNSGLYVVGSSLVRPNFHDIDLVVVGLDFRQIFEYGGVFVGDEPQPDHEIEETKDPESLEYGTNPAQFRKFHIDTTYEIVRLAKAIADQTEYGFNDWSMDYNANPFRQCAYVSDALERWFVSKLELEKGFKHDFTRKIQRPTIDLIFHAENLLVSAWKKLQEEADLPYIPLHELYDPNNDRIENRPPFAIRLPSFVNPTGTGHVRL